MRKGLAKESVDCPKCNGKMHLIESDRWAEGIGFYCGNKDGAFKACKYRASVKTGMPITQEELHTSIGEPAKENVVHSQILTMNDV